MLTSMLKHQHYIIIIIIIGLYFFPSLVSVIHLLTLFNSYQPFHSSNNNNNKSVSLEFIRLNLSIRETKQGIHLKYFLKLI